MIETFQLRRENMLTLQERYDNYVHAISNCQSRILTLDDVHLLYTIFEILSIDIPSYLHLNSLNLFLDEGMIDLEIFNRSSDLREKFLFLEHNCKSRRSAKSIRESSDWRMLFSESDNIFELLYF